MAGWELRHTLKSAVGVVAESESKSAQGSFDSAGAVS